MSVFGRLRNAIGLLPGKSKVRFFGMPRAVRPRMSVLFVHMAVSPVSLKGEVFQEARRGSGKMPTRRPASCCGQLHLSRVMAGPPGLSDKRRLWISLWTASALTRPQRGNRGCPSSMPARRAARRAHLMGIGDPTRCVPAWVRMPRRKPAPGRFQAADGPRAVCRLAGAAAGHLAAARAPGDARRS